MMKPVKSMPESARSRIDGGLLHWVCQDDAEYLNLTEDRLELTPVA
jgi:hypothetical protein